MSEDNHKIIVLDYETTEARVLAHMIAERADIGDNIYATDVPVITYNFKEPRPMFGSRLNMAAAAASLGFAATMPSIPDHQRRGVYSNAAYKRSKRYAKNGRQECERRMYQIANGQLRVENGFIRYQEEENLIAWGSIYDPEIPPDANSRNI